MLGRLTGLSLIGALALSGAAWAQEEITLTISAFSTSQSPNHKLTVDRVIGEIEEKSGGRVKFETYFGGSAYGNSQRQYEQAQRGIVDISHGLFGYTPGRFPMVEILELPFLYEDSIAASKAFWTTYADYMDFEGVKPIAIWLTAMQQTHFNTPVENIPDMAGLKVRAGGPSMVAALAELGAEGVLLPAPGIYEAMQKGVLDGAIGAMGILVAFNVGEVSNYHLKTDITAAPLFLMMNQGKYDSLPDDIKALLDSYSTPEMIGEFAEAFTRSDVRGKEIATSEGHIFRELTEEERADWRAATQPVVDAYLEELEGKGFPAHEFYDAFMAEYERQISMTN
ncbi:TRAP transporter substrate-binding protein [Pseudoruegeria sp. HB172150]|uniref:TRAP transporter substrate-binding protein n=1 Tax=Pseudoruegeria sp. HB172150 TaxID=2721164 RepID=UPI001552FCBA|nr:TRAP transporter substrate-binding protein [Pseudoruegeria sp. HB172150]